MDPIFTEEQLNRMSREDMCSLLKLMQQHQQKAGRSAAETGRKAAESGNKDPDAGRAEKRAGIPERDALGPPDACPEEAGLVRSSEKYADGYTQLNLFNEAEKEADADAPEPDLEEVHPSPYRRRRNVPAKKKKTFPPLKQPKWWSTSWRARTNTVRTAAPNIKWSQRKP